MFSTWLAMTIFAVLQMQVHCTSSIAVASQIFHTEKLKCLQDAPNGNNQSTVTVKRFSTVSRVTSMWHCLVACTNSLNCVSALLPVTDFNTSLSQDGRPTKMPCYLFPDRISNEPPPIPETSFCVTSRGTYTSCDSSYPCYLLPKPDSCITSSGGIHCPGDAKNYLKIDQQMTPIPKATRLQSTTNTRPTPTAASPSPNPTATPSEAGSTSENPNDTPPTIPAASYNHQKRTDNRMMTYVDAVNFCRAMNADIVLVDSKTEFNEVEDLIDRCRDRQAGNNCEDKCYWLNLTWRPEGKEPKGWLINQTTPITAAAVQYWKDNAREPTTAGTAAYIDGNNNCKWTYPRNMTNYTCFTICELW